MSELTVSRRTAYAAIGILAASVGLAAGMVITLGVMQGLPERSVHASATHGVDKYAICTGLLDDRTEVLYFLDYLTGELKGAAIDRQQHQFLYRFSRKIYDDFGGKKKLKNPQFLLVSGMVELQQSGTQRPSRALIYVVEVTTGQAVAYVAPAPTGRRALKKVVNQPLYKFAQIQFRHVEIRDD